jgi:hypothetical protein
MKVSIIELLNKNNFNTNHFNDETLVKKIDLMLENQSLKVELCDSKFVWKRKKNNFKYNMRLTLFTKPNGYVIDEERFVYLSPDSSELSFIHDMINDFINRKNLKYLKNRKPDLDTHEDDPFSEKNIMKDLSKGEGYNHGLD